MRNNKIINIIILLFFIHGILYFIYPQEIYDLNSRIKLIKYLLVFICCFLYCKNQKKYLIYMYMIMIIFILQKISLNKNFKFILFCNYIFPLSVYLYYPFLKKIKNKIILLIYFIINIFGYIEIFFYKNLFPRFADSGYRISSILVNPNNFALTIILMYMYIIEKKIIKNRLNKIIVTINILILLYLSGSRNGMITISIYFLLIIKRIKIKEILAIIALIILTNIYVINKLSLLINTRNLDKVSLTAGRMVQYRMFLKNLNNNFIFPNINNFVYTDNIYMTLWGTFGLFVMILFIVFNIFLLYCSYKKITFKFLIIYLWIGVGENFIYLWPLGYIYWFLVLNIFDERKIRFCKKEFIQY